MAHSTCKHTIQAPAFVPDFIEKVQEPLPSRISVLPRAPLKRRKSNCSHGVSVALQAIPSPAPPHLSYGHVALSVLENAEWPAIDACDGVDSQDFPTQLKRSELENQWACADELARTTYSEEHEERPRLSARQRRLLARKQGICSSRERHGDQNQSKSCHTRGHTNEAAACLASSSSKVAMDSLRESLQSVSTLGLMRSRPRREILTREEEILLSKKMKVGQNLRAVRKRLIKTLGREPSAEHWALSVKLSERELQSKLIEADKARDLIFVANLRLIFSVANKYSHMGMSIEDLTQEGATGLLRGLEKFDHTKGFKLSTYLYWWIREGVKRSLGTHSKTVRISRYMNAKLMLVHQTMTKLSEEGIPVSVQSLSKALNLSDEAVCGILKASKRMISLDKRKTWGIMQVDGDTMHNYIADPCLENNPWNVVDNMYLRDHLDGLLQSTLGEREQEIVRLYYGIDCPNGNGMSFKRIGNSIGLSRERTRKLGRWALRKLVTAGRSMSLDIPLWY